MSELEAWIADCHLLKIDGEGEFRCQAAVWANSATEFRAQLDAHIVGGGYKVLWLEECLPANQYIARHGQQQKVGGLARVVHPGYLVELSQMVALDDGVEAEPENYLIIEEIEGVEPLDAQFGAWPMKNVPDALMEPMFGEVEPTEAEIEHYDGVENVPPMKTYAILDAAKIQFGLSVIEDCEMPFRCLFKGEAAEELKDVAPYLIELDPEKGFTRTLFTHNPDMPDNMSTVHLWHKEPGIYVRSRASFDDIWKHFRKFTRIQDEGGKWYNFRFWESRHINKHLERNDFSDRFMSFDLFGGVIFSISQSVVSFRKRHTISKTVMDSINIDFARIEEEQRHLWLEKLTLKIVDTFPGWDLELQVAREKVAHSVNRMQGYGFKLENHLLMLASWEMIYGEGFEQKDPDGTLEEICNSNQPAIKKFRAFRKRIERLKRKSEN